MQLLRLFCGHLSGLHTYPTNFMLSKNRIEINGVHFAFTTGAIDHYFSKRNEAAEIIIYCERAIKGDLRERGEILLACYEQGGKGKEQAEKFQDSSMLWDWFDELEEGQKIDILTALINSVANRIEGMESAMKAVKGDESEQLKKK
jgi:hypothetical protein